MSEERCSKCKFMMNTHGSEYGRCRRFPPTAQDSYGLGKFPEVMKTSWCGEFKYRDRLLKFVEEKPDADIIAPDFDITTESFNSRKK